jgi:hypothetical protein
MIATLLLAVQVGALFPMASLPTVKTSCVIDSEWASAELRQLGVVPIRATQSPARCRRAERLRRIRRAIENAVEPRGEKSD